MIDYSGIHLRAVLLPTISVYFPPDVEERAIHWDNGCVMVECDGLTWPREAACTPCDFLAACRTYYDIMRK